MICCECGGSTSPARSYEVVSHADHTIDVVCVKCWVKYDYKAFMKGE